ncbi:outer membrane beta-barrel protein [uncultured Winogradskyella sp.]|uniref:outer membrane beta-barrel protein n=1 Tax=uncultured Winogradskyella sp. TaxID=395353 RepID=UPI0026174B13|nr:outer membrane beta-barrel protein [uncultured Winogradskyella sp.]
MKTLAFTLLVACFCTILSAQTEFGVKGGLNFTFFKVTEGDFGTNPDTEIGYYGGVFVDFPIDNDFHLQPELLYKGVGDFKFLNAPIYLKYDVYENAHILVGPSLNYFFDFFSNKFKVRADLSLDYDFSSDLSMHMKYTIGLEELSPNVLFMGLGYRL